MSKKKNTTTPTPHDAAFRSFLANPDVARDFLELHLPAEYRQLCDLSTLKLEPATFVAYSALFDHGLASKSDQRFASIRSTGNLTFSTAF